jgi:hypothetical protein
MGRLGSGGRRGASGLLLGRQRDSAERRFLNAGFIPPPELTVYPSPLVPPLSLASRTAPLTSRTAPLTSRTAPQDDPLWDAGAAGLAPSPRCDRSLATSAAEQSIISELS